MPDYTLPPVSKYLPQQDPVDLSQIGAVYDSQQTDTPSPLAMQASTQPASSGLSPMTLLSLLGNQGGGKSQGGSSPRKSGKKPAGGHRGVGAAIGIKGLPDSIHNSVNENRRIAQALIARKYPQWSHKDYKSLVALWNRESGWQAGPSSDNPTSSAYGIPQALTELHHLGSSYKNSPVNQIQWGLKYIKGRYGSPSAANRFSLAHHYY
jgi:hypothetical protein